MPAVWRIDVRLGDDPAATPLRSLVVTAEDEADALRQVLVQAERDIAAADEISLTGQEEVFAISEIARGESEHHARAGGHTDEPS